MNKTIKNIFHIKAVHDVNTFIYYFKRLWLIGKCIPDTAYANDTVKLVLSIIVPALKISTQFFRKAIYLFFFIGIPLLISLDKSIQLPMERFDFAVHIFFFMSCFIGPLGESHVFKVEQIKLICLKYFRMDAKKYTQANIIIQYVPFMIYFLPGLLVMALLTGGSILHVLLLWLSLFCFRMMGEALQVWFYEKKSIILSRNNIIMGILIVIGVFLAYMPMFLNINLRISELLFHPVIILFYLILGGYSFYYIMWGYSNYRKKIIRSMDTKFMTSEMLKKSKESVFTTVEMKEEDLDHSKLSSSNLQNLKGYAYMNQLFFIRHRRQLVRPVFYRLAFVLLAFLVGLGFYIINPTLAIRFSERMDRIVPTMVFLMYGITTTDKACKAMFYNCDISLLRYGFYRKPRAILSNFRIRLLRISLHNLIVGFSICLAMIGFCEICQTNWMTRGMLMLYLVILLLSVLFTVHHLFLYYVFQPYSLGLEVKNPFFKILNGLMYVICYICFMIEASGVVFTLGVLISTILYIAIALILVYRFAPKYFRVK